MAFNILVVDDEKDIRELVSGILEDNDYKATTAGSFVEALELLNKRRPNLVILDVWLGDSDRDGLRLLEIINKNYDYVPVIMMSGHSTIETAVSAIKKGAYDFIEKPFDSRRLITSIEKAIETSKLKIENDELKVKAKFSGAILGNSQNSENIRMQVEKIAPLNGRCVILGPTGADKEIIAREIHNNSQRSKSPFGIISCKIYGVKQLESEIFGTQLTSDEGIIVQPGLLERINGGTLFIDDLQLTSFDFQQKFLKILKTDTFSRIGTNEKTDIDIRIIAGFPSNIDQLIRNNVFSDELYCRLNANLIKILPLKSRREDITYLLEYYMHQAAKANNTKPRKFSAEALGILNGYSWPGDVLQMKNMIDWILTVSISEGTSSNTIEIDDLPQEILGIKNEELVMTHPQFMAAVSELSIKDARDAFEKEYLEEQLKKFSGNISKTAKFIGMERSALHRKLKALDMVDQKSQKSTGDEADQA